MDLNFHRKKDPSRYLLLFIICSLLVHLTVLILKWSKPAPELADQRINLRILYSKTKNQIVRSEDSRERTPRDEAYLSDKTRSFDRETRARNIDTYQSQQKGNKGKSKVKDLSLSDLSPKEELDPFAQAAKEYSKAKAGTKSGENSRSISSTNDYLEEVPLGDLTELNTVEYKYYGFYHRIRQKLEQFWGRSIQETAEELMQEGRSIASEDHITSLIVVMNSQGKIMEVTVRGASGVREFDEAAIRSFNEAGPFPNPPKDLIVKGRVIIEWGFVVKT